MIFHLDYGIVDGSIHDFILDTFRRVRASFLIREQEGARQEIDGKNIVLVDTKFVSIVETLLRGIYANYRQETNNEKPDESSFLERTNHF